MLVLGKMKNFPEVMEECLPQKAEGTCAGTAVIEGVGTIILTTVLTAWLSAHPQTALFS